MTSFHVYYDDRARITKERLKPARHSGLHRPLELDGKNKNGTRPTSLASSPHAFLQNQSSGHIILSVTQSFEKLSSRKRKEPAHVTHPQPRLQTLSLSELDTKVSQSLKHCWSPSNPLFTAAATTKIQGLNLSHT